MQNFSTHGLENPEKSVMKRGVCEKWVMGIIEDDLPYSLGEKLEMKKVLNYILPKGLTAPSHQTVVRTRRWGYRGLSGFGCWLQLVCCAYLLTLSEYFGVS